MCGTTRLDLRTGQSRLFFFLASLWIYLLLGVLLAYWLTLQGLGWLVFFFRVVRSMTLSIAPPDFVPVCLFLAALSTSPHLALRLVHFGCVSERGSSVPSR